MIGGGLTTGSITESNDAEARCASHTFVLASVVPVKLVHLPFNFVLYNP